MVHDELGEREFLVGRWPVDTAIGVIASLEDAGIRARAQRTGADVEVYVPDDARHRAHRVLDRTGARAAVEPAGRRSAPTVPPEDVEPADEGDRPLLAERMRRLGRPLALVLAVLIAITLSYQGPVIGAIAVAIAVGAVAVWLRNRVRDDDITYGDDD